MENKRIYNSIQQVTAVEVAGKIIEKIGPILATKY